LSDQARDLAAMLRDRRRAAIHWVTHAEELAASETADAVASLEQAGLRVEELVVNRMLPNGPRCPVCDRRRALERGVLARIRREIGRGKRLRIVAAEAREPMGVKALAAIGKTLMSQGSSLDALRTSGARHARRGDSSLTLSLLKDERLVAAESFDVFAAHLLFFGGKGGVGKTTVAAAAALRLARADPNRRVLLLSTDPAHSLGDVFASPVGDQAARVADGPVNLVVRELDASRAWTMRRAAVEAALDELASAVGTEVGGVNARVSELLDLAPPGVDELFGLLSVFDARADHDLIVVDTAPTGHALRLLDMPGIVQEWVQALLRVLLKYRALVRPGSLAAELVAISRSVREFRSFLQNPRQTRFVVVTRAAESPLAETARLRRRLRRLKLATPAMVVNALTLAPGRCPWCQTTASDERRHLRLLRAGGAARGCVIIQTPLSSPPPRGPRALEEWGAQWLTLTADG